MRPSRMGLAAPARTAASGDGLGERPGHAFEWTNNYSSEARQLRGGDIA